MSVKDLNEFKADREDSELPDPTGKEIKKRPLDKKVPQDKSKSVDDDKKDDLLDDKTAKKFPNRKADKKGIKENLDALFDGEDISEAFSEKAAALFEASVMERVNDHTDMLKQEFAEKLDEEKVKLSENVDKYIDYIVSEWVEENELAVQQGIKAEISESFLGGLKTLFDEHYVSIPDDKVDVVETLTDKIDELESSLNRTISENLRYKTFLEDKTAEEIVEELINDMADTKKEKFKKLVEDIEFTSPDAYKDKVSIIKESFESSKTVSVEDDLNEEFLKDEDENELDESDPMSIYVKSISRSIQK